MKNRISVLVTAVTTVFCACTRNVDDVRPGPISRETVLTTFGPPKAKFLVDSDRWTSDAMSYGERSTNIQFFDDRVVGVSRSPGSEEEHLNFWLDAWRKKGIRWQVVVPPSTEHDRSTVQYRADAENIILTVSAGTGRVFRVHHFERGPSL